MEYPLPSHLPQIPGSKGLSDSRTWIWCPKHLSEGFFSPKVYLRLDRCLGPKLQAVLSKNSSDPQIRGQYDGSDLNSVNVPCLVALFLKTLPIKLVTQLIEAVWSGFEEIDATWWVSQERQRHQKMKGVVASDWYVQLSSDFLLGMRLVGWLIGVWHVSG